MAQCFTGTTPTLDTAIANAVSYGQWRQMVHHRLTAATTAATVNCGSVSVQRYPISVTVPSDGTDVSGYVISKAVMANEDANTMIMAALEYNLGSLAMATGTFTDGVAMPTKTIEGASVDTASFIPMLVVDASLTATTPVITTTFTDQDNNASQSAALTLPTNALINSAFLMQPHLGADTAIKNVSNIAKSAGTAGTLSVRGLLPLAISMNFNAALPHPIPILGNVLPKFLCSSGETIAFYRFYGTTTNEMVGALWGNPE